MMLPTEKEAALTIFFVDAASERGVAMKWSSERNSLLLFFYGLLRMC